MLKECPSGGLEGLLNFQRNIFEKLSLSSEERFQLIGEGRFSEDARRTYCLNLCEYRMDCNIARTQGYVNEFGYESYLLGVRIIPLSKYSDYKLEN